MWFPSSPSLFVATIGFLLLCCSGGAEAAFTSWASVSFLQRTATCSPRYTRFDYQVTVPSANADDVAAVMFEAPTTWPLIGALTQDLGTGRVGIKYKVAVTAGNSIGVSLEINDLYTIGSGNMVYWIYTKSGQNKSFAVSGPVPYVYTNTPNSVNLVMEILDFPTAAENRDQGGYPRVNLDFEPCTPQELNTKMCTEETGIVQDYLGSDGLPVWKGCSTGTCTSVHSKATFDQWWRYTPGVNKGPFYRNLTFTLTDANTMTYGYYNKYMFPIDGVGYGNLLNCGRWSYPNSICATGKAPTNSITWSDDSKDHNFGFCTKIHTTFAYRNKNENFEFTGDDDVFAYIDGKLVIDIGGIHGPKSDSIILTDTAKSKGGVPLNLVKNSVYNFDFFFCERHHSGSTFKASTSLSLYNCEHMDECGLCTGACNMDTDGDKTVDCLDACFTDPNKIFPGECGCGVPDVDTNGNGVPDCLEQCLTNGAAVGTYQVGTTTGEI